MYTWFFRAESWEQDSFYLRGGVVKMVKLGSGQPQRVGGKFIKYRIDLVDETKVLGADMQKIGLTFDYVSNQWVDVDKSKAGRYSVEPIGSVGYFEIVEKEGSEVDKLLRKNIGKDPSFEFSVTGPFGKLKYIGSGRFYE